MTIISSVNSVDLSRPGPAITIRDVVPGDGPWSRRARHLVRAQLVRRAAWTWVNAHRAVDNPAWDNAIGLLLWAEAHAAHPNGPGRQTWTARPAWWTAAGLPDRRQRSAGAAWTAACAEAAVQIGYGDTPNLDEAAALVRVIREVDRNLAVEIAAALCEALGRDLEAQVTGVAFGIVEQGDPDSVSPGIALATGQDAAMRLARAEALLAEVLGGRQAEPPRELTVSEAEGRTIAAAGACPFCGHRPVIESSPDGRSWAVVERCEHAVTGGGQDFPPILDRARDWQGPGWPWREGWPVAGRAE